MAAGTAVTASSAPLGRRAIRHPAATATLTAMAGMSVPGSASQGSRLRCAAKNVTTGASMARSNPSGPACPRNSRPSAATVVTHPARVSTAQVRTPPSSGLPRRTGMAPPFAAVMHMT